MNANTPQDIRHHNNEALLNSKFLDILHGIQSSYATDELRKRMHPLRSTKELANYLISRLPGHSIRSNSPILLIDALETYGEEIISGKLLSGIPIYSITDKVEFDFKNHKLNNQKLKITLNIINNKYKYSISTSQEFENCCSRILDTQKCVLQITISNKIKSDTHVRAYIKEVQHKDHGPEYPLDIYIEKEQQSLYAWAEYKDSVYIAYHDILPKYFTDRLTTSHSSLNIPRLSHGINRLTTNTLRSLIDNTQHITLENEKFKILSETLHALSEWAVDDTSIKDETKYNETTAITTGINIHLEKLKSIKEVTPRSAFEIIESYKAVIEYEKSRSNEYERILLEASNMYIDHVKNSDILKHIKEELLKCNDKLSGAEKKILKNSDNNRNGMDKLKPHINRLMDKKALPQLGNKNIRSAAG